MTNPWRTVSDKPKPHCWRLVAMQTRGYLQRACDGDSLAELQASLVGYMAQRGSSIVGAADTRTRHDPTHLQAPTRGAMMAEARLQHGGGDAGDSAAQPTVQPHHWDAAGATRTDGKRLARKDGAPVRGHGQEANGVTPGRRPGARAGSGTPLSRRRGARTRSPSRSFGRADARRCGWPCLQRRRGPARGEYPHIKCQLSWPIASERRTRTEKSVTHYALRTHMRMQNRVGNMQHATWLWLRPRGRSVYSRSMTTIGPSLRRSAEVEVEARGALFLSWHQLSLPDLTVHARRPYSDRHAQAQRRRRRPQYDPTDDGSSVWSIGVHEDQGGRPVRVRREGAAMTAPRPPAGRYL